VYVKVQDRNSLGGLLLPTVNERDDFLLTDVLTHAQGETLVYNVT